MAQPIYIALNYKNVYTLSGNNETNYYYNKGKIYLDGQENLNEVKQLDLSLEQTHRITRIKQRADKAFSGTTFVTHEGIRIPYSPNDEIFVSHNYISDDNISRDYNSDEVKNSWWYDTNLHRSYKVYIVVRYYREANIGGNTYYDWRAVDTYVAYKDATADTTNGIYTFERVPVEDVEFSSSVRFSTPNNFKTWDKATLNVYKNNTIYTSSLIENPTVTQDRIEVNFPLLTATDITSSDQWRISVSVGGDNKDVQDPLLVSEYSMSIVSPVDELRKSFLGFVEPLSLENYTNCFPTLNNAVISRPSLFIQDVDYTTGIALPQNSELINSNLAVKASTPDSNYSQYSHTILRYFGSKTNRSNFNSSASVIFDEDQRGNEGETVPNNISPYSFTTDNLGAVPNTELLNYYIGYFNRIVDPYPLLNNKTAYFIKYIVDPNKTLFDPSLDEDNFTNLKSVFRVSDIDNKPTNAKASITTTSNFDELKELEKLNPVYRVGGFPTPILYSQTSSVGYSNTITITNGASSSIATSPYWEYYNSNPKRVCLVPTVLNINYNNNSSMVDLSYTSGENVDFPNNVEPSYTSFPPITEKFNIKEGDEIRFENDESKTFLIESSSFKSVSGQNSLVLDLNRDIDPSINKDFFVIRRFKSIDNYVILNQQKPYSNPPAENSAEGILSPEFKLSTLNIDVDEVISLAQNQSLENNITINNQIPVITSRYQVKECDSVSGAKTEYVVENSSVVLGSSFQITSGDGITYYEAYKNVSTPPNTYVKGNILTGCGASPISNTFNCTTAEFSAAIDAAGNIIASVAEGTISSYTPTTVIFDGNPYTVTGFINIPEGYDNYPGTIECVTTIGSPDCPTGWTNNIIVTNYPQPNATIAYGDVFSSNLPSIAQNFTTATLISENTDVTLSTIDAANNLTIEGVGCTSTSTVVVELRNDAANYCPVRLSYRNISVSGCPFVCSDWTGEVTILQNGEVYVSNTGGLDVTITSTSPYGVVNVDTVRDVTVDIIVPLGYANSGTTISCVKQATQPATEVACHNWVLTLDRRDSSGVMRNVRYEFLKCDGTTVRRTIDILSSVTLEVCSNVAITEEMKTSGPPSWDINRPTNLLEQNWSYRGSGDCRI